MKAALAEAWHVDGCFAKAMAGWEALTLANYDRAGSALKTAISCFSLQDYENGVRWLDLAEVDGASTEEILYVRAQCYWHQGQVEQAINIFHLAEHAAPHLGKASNALGVLYWQLGWFEKARQQFVSALQRDLHDGEALVNLTSVALREGLAETLSAVDLAQNSQQMRDALEQATDLQPHRAEAFVWYARLLRRMHMTQDAQDALSKARLRSHFLGQVSSDQQDAHLESCGQVRVRGTLTAAYAQLTLFYTYTHGQMLPGYLAVNKGYQRVEAVGVALVAVCKEEVRLLFPLPDASNIAFYRIPAHAWQQLAEGTCLEVTVAGTPIPPCVALSDAEIELDGRSGWLPLPLSLQPLHWQIDVQVPHDVIPFLSSDESEMEAVGLIALRHPKMVSLDVQSETTERITGLASEDSPLLRLAPLLAQRTHALWERLVAAPHSPCPDMLIVEQPDSLFCYARQKYIRLPSGLARQFAYSAQICHEVGHLWWGLDVRFSLTDAWLGEALAEYSLHLAEEAGWLTGYRQNSLALLRSMYHGTLPTQGLVELHKSGGTHAAYGLRIKGGFMIAMLRTLMKEDAFWSFLRAVHHLGQKHSFDAYHFFALASYWHGSSLNWFANQWIYAKTGLIFSVEDPRLQQHNDLFCLSFNARCHGIATPGGPVTVLIQSERGKELRVPVNLNLGSAIVTVTLPTRPEKIIIDPDLCWYAEQASTSIHRGNV
jgi:Tfp pilus assembly protein PilF